MARATAFLKDEVMFAFVDARARFAGIRAAQPLDCVRTIHLLDRNAVRSSARAQPFRAWLKRKRTDLAELWVMLAQLAVLVVLMSLFAALLSVRG